SEPRSTSVPLAPILTKISSATVPPLVTVPEIATAVPSHCGATGVSASDTLGDVRQVTRSGLLSVASGLQSPIARTKTVKSSPPPTQVKLPAATGPTPRSPDHSEPRSTSVPLAPTLTKTCSGEPLPLVTVPEIWTAVPSHCGA